MKKCYNISIYYFVLLAFLTIGCNKFETLKPKQSANFGDVNTNVGVNEIVAIPDQAHNSIKENFTRYTKLSSTSDLPIHIIAQNEVTDAIIVRVKAVLSSYLKAVPDSRYGFDKLMISDKIAENKGTIAIFNSQLELAEATNSLSDVDLEFLFISQADIVFEDSEDYMENRNIDHVFGKIASFILDLGIKDVYPDYYAEVKEAALNAVESNYWFSISIPEWQSDEELLTMNYFTTIIGIYYDFWAHTHTGLSSESSFRYNSRNALFFGDTRGYNAITGFFAPQIDINIAVNLPNDTLFPLIYTPQLEHSFKTQHLVNVNLLGDNDINVTGNQYNNTVSGNNGENTFKVRGKYSEYVLSIRSNVTTITDTVSNRDGQDAIQYFEHIQFKDTLINVL